MCGRFVLSATPDEVRRLFAYDEQPNFPPRYNIAPTQPIAVVAWEADRRRFLLARWGLIPTWVKDPADFTLLINARAETAAEKPAFRAAMRHRRVLIPASGYYEWHRPASGPKQAYWIHPRAGGVIAFAGLMETYMSKDGSEIDTACILTCEAEGTIGAIHNRMPVPLDPLAYADWLDVRRHEPRDVARYLVPRADDVFEAVAVSDRVNAVRNDDPGLIEPLASVARAEESAAPASPARKPSRPPKAGSGGGGQMDLF